MGLIPIWGPTYPLRLAIPQRLTRLLASLFVVYVEVGTGTFVVLEEATAVIPYRGDYAL